MLHHYRAMADDPLRLLAFRRALEAQVKPGQVVADIGCGLGTFSIYACRAGARRVLAVEEGTIRKVAAQVIAQNGCEDRVQVIAGRSTDVAVPERADVVIFEDHLSSLLSARLVSVMADIHARWLAPGGRVLPSSARLYVSPVEDLAGYREIDRFAHVKDVVAGIDFGGTTAQSFATPLARRLTANHLLAQPQIAATFDFGKPWSADSPGLSLAWTGTMTATRTGVLHGLLLWFALEVGDTWLESGPLSPPSAWNQTLLPFAEPLMVEEGRRLDVKLAWAPWGDASVWRWSVSAATATRQNDSLASLALESADLRVASPNYIPEPSETMEIVQFILAEVDGRTSIEEIGGKIARRFPSRFGRVASACAYIGTVLDRCK